MLLYVVDMYTLMKEYRYVAQGKTGRLETFVVTLSGFYLHNITICCIVM